MLGNQSNQQTFKEAGNNSATEQILSHQQSTSALQNQPSTINEERAPQDGEVTNKISPLQFQKAMKNFNEAEIAKIKSAGSIHEVEFNTRVKLNNLMVSILLNLGR